MKKIKIISCILCLVICICCGCSNEVDQKSTSSQNNKISNNEKNKTIFAMTAILFFVIILSEKGTLPVIVL